MYKKILNYGQTIATNRAIELATPILPWFISKKRLLDFGCGIGHLGCHIARETQQNLISLDVRKYPMSHPSLELMVFDGETIPYPDNSFDTTLVAYTLHHTQFPENILKEIIRVSKDTIIISEDLLKTRRHVPIEVIKDVFANYFYAHITMQYKTIEEWEFIFKKLNLTIEDKIFHTSGKLLRFEHISWKLKKLSFLQAHS